MNLWLAEKRCLRFYPVSFREFVNFKTEYKYSDRLVDYFAIENTKTLNFIEEYLNFGGYPRVVIESGLEEKR